MKKNYMSPAVASVDFLGEELMIVKASDPGTGASEALSNKKEFEGQSGWNSEDWSEE